MIPLELESLPSTFSCITVEELWATLYSAEVVTDPTDVQITHIVIGASGVRHAYGCDLWQSAQCK